MGKYLHRFQTKDDLYTYLKSAGYTEPMVSCIESDKGVQFQNIRFEDPEIERIVANTWNSGKTPVSLAKIVRINGIGGAFSGNTVITSFNEFEHFVSVSALTNSSTRGCFYGCQNLESIKFPTSLLRIDGYCFDGSGFSALTFNEGLTTLKEYAFTGYTNLVYIEFPGTLTTIEKNNFRPYRINLATNIVFRGETPPTFDPAASFQYYNGAYRYNTAAKIYVPYSSDHSVLQAYQNNSGFADIISHGINVYELDENGNIPEN